MSIIIMRNYASTVRRHGSPVTCTVITCPAAFKQHRRKQTTPPPPMHGIRLPIFFLALSIYFASYYSTRDQIVHCMRRLQSNRNRLEDRIFVLQSKVCGDPACTVKKLSAYIRNKFRQQTCRDFLRKITECKIWFRHYNDGTIFCIP